MTPREEGMLRSRIVSGIGIALVAVAYAGAIWNMLRTTHEEQWTDRKVIRICHWQLESGFREGIDCAIREFEKRFPDTKVVQLPIYERAYKQFIQTQLIGGTAPDLIERGMDVDDNVVPRYYYPLTDELFRPNAFNEGTDLAGEPWITTFKDALASLIQPGNQEYYMVGLNNHTVRIFYNRTLYRRIMGHDRLPVTFRDLIAVCTRVKQYSDSLGPAGPVFPIAASSYQAERMRDVFSDALLASLLWTVYDTRFDVSARPTEKYLAYVRGGVEFTSDEIRASEMVQRELAAYYQPGFMATDRQEAGFAFAQQRALMISSGSWDYQSMRLQAADNGFEIGVIPFPLPDSADPAYGRYVDGQTAEENRTGVSFGLSRSSRHPDVALAFMKFLTCKEINEKVNAIIGWIPSIRNTRVVDDMKPFLPVSEGMPLVWQPVTVVGTKWFKTGANDLQAYWEFISGVTTYEQFVAAVEKRFVVDGMADVVRHAREADEELLPIEHARSALAITLAFSADSAATAAAAVKTVALTSSLAARAVDMADLGARLHALALNPPGERARRMAGTAEYRQFAEFYGFAAE